MSPMPMGTPNMMGHCQKCKATRPLSDFANNKQRKCGLNAHCRECMSKYYFENKERIIKRMKAHRASDPAKFRDSRRLKKYGLSPEEIKAMLLIQSDSCAICIKPFENEKFHVDHSHATGRIRGLLCSPCNTSLGLLNDSPQNLRMAIAYLGESE